MTAPLTIPHAETWEDEFDRDCERQELHDRNALRRQELLATLEGEDPWTAPDGFGRSLTPRELIGIARVASWLDVRGSAENVWTDGDAAEENLELAALLAEVRACDLNERQAVQHAIERWAQRPDLSVRLERWDRARWKWAVNHRPRIAAKGFAAEMLDVSFTGVPNDPQMTRPLHPHEITMDAPAVNDTVIKPAAPSATDVDTWGVIDWNKVDPPITWLVDTVLQEATVSVAFGLPNSLKTWTCYQFALAVASGTPWLGRPTRKGLVVIVDYESSERQARRRMRRLQAGLGADMRNVRYVNPTEQLTDPKLWERLERLKPTLVIVDSLARGTLGAEENGTAMQVPLDNAKRLARRCGAASIFIHHKNKSGKEGQASIRGSSAIYAAAEGALEFLDFERIDADVQRARLHCDRLKESTAFEDIRLELSNARGLVEVDARVPLQRDELTIDGVKARVLLQVANNPGRGEQEIMRLAGLTSRTARDLGKDALKELADNGRVTKMSVNRGHVYSMPTSPEAKEAAVLRAMKGGISGQVEILRAAPMADADTLLRLAEKGRIFKSTGGWHLHGKADEHAAE